MKGLNLKKKKFGEKKRRSKRRNTEFQGEVGRREKALEGITNKQ